MVRPDSLFRTTTPIKYPSGQHGGTGFFFNQDERTFLITNEHVACPEKEDIEEIFIYTRRRSDLTKPKRQSIPVQGAIEHPDGEDIVAIPLVDRLDTAIFAGRSGPSTGNLAFSSYHIPNDGQITLQGVSVVGYPEEFYDIETAFPTRQELSIATVYGIDFQNQPCFLAYGRTYGGTSGSPVVLTPGGGLGLPTKLVGINFESYAPPPSRSLEELKECVESSEDHTVHNKDDFNKVLYPKTIIETLSQL